MLNKIDATLLNKITVNNFQNNDIDCVIFGNTKYDIDNISNQKILKRVEKISIINGVVAKIKSCDLHKVACLKCVKYIASTTNVLSCVNVSKNIINTARYGNVPCGDFSIAVIDTGIYPHIDFVLGKNNIVAFHDVINNIDLPYDDNGHGTFVSGLIFSKGFCSCGMYEGVDPCAKLVCVKALDANGETNSANILKAMQWVYDNRVKYKIKIVCMSFGSVVLDRNDPLILGAETLWDAGIVVCSACGNNGPEISTVKSPGASSKIITVGAMDDHRTIDGAFNVENFEVAEFSSRGPILNQYKPDCVVSGVDVVSACNYKINKKFYSAMSGTSVATPIITGVCSMILKKNKFFTPNQIKKYILNHCTIISGDKNKEGRGWFNFNSI